MSGSSESYTIDLWVPNNDPRKLRNYISEWIKTRRLLRKIDIIYEDENQIKIKHEVHSVRGWGGARWTLNIMATYNLTFIIKDDIFKIDALIQFPSSKNDSIDGLFWKLKCSDFLLGFFKIVNLIEDTRLLKALYLKEDLVEFLEVSKNSFFKSLLFIHGFVTIVSLLFSRRLDAIIEVNLFVLLWDAISYVIHILDTRNYRRYLDLHYE
jgi:hypothetical protein